MTMKDNNTNTNPQMHICKYKAGCYVMWEESELTQYLVVGVLQ